jgi:hypothetical protein
VSRICFDDVFDASGSIVPIARRLPLLFATTRREYIPVPKAFAPLMGQALGSVATSCRSTVTANNNGNQLISVPFDQRNN